MSRNVPTLEDVASLAGVDKSTASRVLTPPSGKPAAYTEQTRQKVKEAAAKLGYRPSKLARGLTLSKTGIVGLTVPSLTDSFFPGVVSAIEARLVEKGLSVILADTRADAQIERARIDDLLGWRVDGLIIAPVQQTTGAGVFWQLWHRRMPFVLLDRNFPETPFNSVTTNDEAGATMAVEHLIGLGHSRIAWAGGPLSISTNRLRHAGYTATLIRHGIIPDPALAQIVPPTEEGGQEAARKLLAADPRPTAVFCFSDHVAMGVLEACRQQGVRVPQGLAVVGYADLPHSGQLRVGLTTVRQPLEALGLRAAELLLASMEGRSRPEQVVVGVELVIRASTVGEGPNSGP